ncbi:MAG: selenium cofactor biosynthesis protein YqeC [Clostridium sp.]|uniref:selenium cofactor biosynthesis protein YqeC n=1 Tax=Clostridium sp. TaxID=1506 RepID=UPI003F341206
MIKYLKALTNIKKGDIISVIGSGGKTTFIYNLAYELKLDKVLISTTTKMLDPKRGEVDYIFYLNECKYISVESGRTFMAERKINDNKVCGNIMSINKYSNYFDYTLLECDGSKGKPLKGWRNNEPVIIDKTTKTIGIIAIHIIGEKISDDNVHRMELFNSICKTKVGDEITLEVVANIITDPNGLFKNYKGEKILFLNRIEDKNDRKMAYKLLEILKERNIKSLKVIGGSLNKKEYYTF